MGDTILDHRREMLLRWIDPRGQRGLEIGPYLNPTIRKDEGDVRYLDFYSTAELAAREQERRAPGTVIPEVDYVVKSDDYYRWVDDRFDYVIANHVIEHVDNPVQWLIDLARLVHDDGVMFLTVPDKKYNFDRYRYDTPLSHLLADWFRGHGEPREHGVDIALYYDTGYVGKPLDVDEKFDLERLRREFAADSHPGRHNHVFQSETFVATVVRPLQKLGVWPFTLVEFGGAEDHHGEFYVVLQKRPEAVAFTAEEFYQPWGSVRAKGDGDDSPERLRELLVAREAELARLRAEVEALRASWSWRVTGPVRSLVRALGVGVSRGKRSASDRAS